MDRLVLKTMPNPSPKAQADARGASDVQKFGEKAAYLRERVEDNAFYLVLQQREEFGAFPRIIGS
jgi:hypothetical protein